MGGVVQPMWNECPAVTRTVLVGYTISSVGLTLMNSAIHLPLRQMFYCSLGTTFGNMYLWTLVTSPLFTPFAGGMSFLMMLFEIFMGLQYFPAKERELGSCTFAFWLALASCAQNLIFLFFMGALCALETSKHYLSHNQGLWPLLMVVLSMQMLSDPEGVQNVWGVVQVPNKWYPAALVAFFCLLNQGIMWAFIAGIAVGYLAFVRPSLHIDRALPSISQVDRIEQKVCGGHRSCWGGSWLPVSSRGCAPVRTAEPASQSGPVPGVWGRLSSTASSGKFAVFSGAGNRLGEDDSGTSGKDANSGGVPLAAAAPSDAVAAPIEV